MNEEQTLYIREVAPELIEELTQGDNVKELLGVTDKGESVLYVPKGSIIQEDGKPESPLFALSLSAQFFCNTRTNTIWHCYRRPDGRWVCRDTRQPC